jgi:Transcriptional regulator, AbiEi antitoxin
VHARQAVPDGLARLARLQAGVVSREQVLGHGFPQSGITRMLAQGSWQRLERGLYLMGPLDPGWLSLAWAGTLIGGDQARLGGLAAAHLHGLVEPAPRDLLVLVPAAGPRLASRGVWVFQRERPAARLRRTNGSPPRLCVETPSWTCAVTLTRRWSPTGSPPQCRPG